MQFALKGFVVEHLVSLDERVLDDVLDVKIEVDGAQDVPHRLDFRVGRQHKLQQRRALKVVQSVSARLVRNKPIRTMFCQLSIT